MSEMGNEGGMSIDIGPETPGMSSDSHLNKWRLAAFTSLACGLATFGAGLYGTIKGDPFGPIAMGAGTTSIGAGAAGLGATANRE